MKIKLKNPGGIHGVWKYDAKTQTLEIEPYFYPGQGQQLVALAEVTGDGGASNRKVLNVTATGGDLKCVKTKTAEERVKPAFDKKATKGEVPTNEPTTTGPASANTPISPAALAGTQRG